MALLTDIIVVATVALTPAASTGLQFAFISPAVNIIHEYGKRSVGSKIGVSHCHSPRPWQAQLTAHHPGIVRDAAHIGAGPEVMTDSAPLAIEVDFDPTRIRIGAASEPDSRPGGWRRRGARRWGARRTEAGGWGRW